MKAMRVPGKPLWILMLIVTLGALLYRYETTVVPQGTVRVVDEAGSSRGKVGVLNTGDIPRLSRGIITPNLSLTVMAM
jgi:hypothetical protein